MDEPNDDTSVLGNKPDDFPASLLKDVCPPSLEDRIEKYRFWKKVVIVERLVNTEKTLEDNEIAFNLSTDRLRKKILELESELEFMKEALFHSEQYVSTLTSGSMRKTEIIQILSEQVATLKLENEVLKSHDLKMSMTLDEHFVKVKDIYAGIKGRNRNVNHENKGTGPSAKIPEIIEEENLILPVFDPYQHSIIE